MLGRRRAKGPKPWENGAVPTDDTQPKTFEDRPLRCLGRTRPAVSASISCNAKTEATIAREEGKGLSILVAAPNGKQQIPGPVLSEPTGPHWPLLFQWKFPLLSRTTFNHLDVKSQLQCRVLIFGYVGTRTIARANVPPVSQRTGYRDIYEHSVVSLYGSLHHGHLRFIHDLVLPRSSPMIGGHSRSSTAGDAKNLAGLSMASPKCEAIQGRATGIHFNQVPMLPETHSTCRSTSVQTGTYRGRPKTDGTETMQQISERKTVWIKVPSRLIISTHCSLLLHKSTCLDLHTTITNPYKTKVRIFASNIICLSVGLESRQSAPIFKYSPSIGYKYRYTHTNTAQQVCFAHLRLARVVPTVSTFRRESQHRLMNLPSRIARTTTCLAPSAAGTRPYNFAELWAASACASPLQDCKTQVVKLRLASRLILRLISQTNTSMKGAMRETRHCLDETGPIAAQCSASKHLHTRLGQTDFLWTTRRDRTSDTSSDPTTPAPHRLIPTRPKTTKAYRPEALPGWPCSSQVTAHNTFGVKAPANGQLQTFAWTQLTKLSEHVNPHTSCYAPYDLTRYLNSIQPSMYTHLQAKKMPSRRQASLTPKEQKWSRSKGSGTPESSSHDSLLGHGAKSQPFGGASVHGLTYNHLRNADHRLHSCIVLSTFSLAGLSPDKITKSARGGGSFPLVNAQPARFCCSTQNQGSSGNNFRRCIFTPVTPPATNSPFYLVAHSARSEVYGKTGEQTQYLVASRGSSTSTTNRPFLRLVVTTHGYFCHGPYAVFVYLLRTVWQPTSNRETVLYPFCGMTRTQPGASALMPKNNHCVIGALVQDPILVEAYHVTVEQ
ncbi:uncharacterized protein CLUP02_10600 [Colletotrichum lupini]|uniref:Uncharacterized protein n=1 Tax=Colletotrichum lupini TaxID=145971 RepID=A0A9Q8WIY1_9PEZI|nr:uncharacterized protein CLUP02_10600 [Colletotrichum lupini]UQC85104.1 hypothetical protein CLUP02_10600 [Colletotrichum lupini]